MMEMKDSGIEWIGEIPGHWGIIPFKTCMIERQEKNNPVVSEERLSLSIELGVTLYSEKTTNLDRFKEDFSQYKIAHVGDLVLNSMNMIVGAAGVSPYFGCVSPAYYTFFDKEPDHITAKYFDFVFHTKPLLRFLFSIGKGIYAIERGDDRVNTCRLKVSREDLRSMKVPFPPVSEQRNIVSILNSKCSDIDQIIENTKKSIGDYKKLKQSVITDAVTKGIHGARQMKNSGIKWIGFIPDEWLVSKVKYETQCNMETLGEQTDDDYEFDYIDIGSVEYGVGITHLERYRFNSAPSRARRIVHEDDVIVSTVRTYLKAMAKIGSIGFPTIVSTGFAVLSCKKRMTADYLYYYVQSVPFIEYVTTHSTGIGYPSINSTDLISAPILMPSIAEQEEIVHYLNRKCSEIDSLIASKEKFIAELESYKKSLIYEYVTGKREVC